MNDLEEPIVKPSSRFNLFTSIWIVPFIAFLISLWLIYQHYSKLGPEIKIKFNDSSRLVAGQSVIKYRNVPIGKVAKIELSKDGKGVVIVASIDKSAEDYLNNSTKFWIVKPEVDYSGVSGLDTLISGSYIDTYAKKGEYSKYVYDGQSKRYRDKNSGIYLKLKYNGTVGVKVGTPINYRNVEVGSIEKVTLNSDHQTIDITLFIDRDYKELVNSSTKFWIESFAKIGIKNGQLDIKLSSVFSHLAFGGISFETKFDKIYSGDISKMTYKLYLDKDEIQANDMSLDKPVIYRFAFQFNGMISGFRNGAIIKYQGFELGRVDTINVGFDRKSKSMTAIAQADIDTSLFADSQHKGIENIAYEVSRGLKARLEAENQLVDTKFINLIYTDDNHTKINIEEQYITMMFPVDNNKKSDIIVGLNKFTDKLNALDLTALMHDSRGAIRDIGNLAKVNTDPLLEMLNTVKKTSENIDETLQKIDKITSDKSMQKMPENINKAIDDLAKTLKATKSLLKGYRSNSLFGDKVSQMLKEINRSSQETKRLLKKLNKKPNSLIFGD